MPCCPTGNSTVTALWPFKAERSFLLTFFSSSPSSSACSSVTTPQAEVILVTRSIKISSPSVLCAANVSATILSANAISQTAISFLCKEDTSFFSPVLTSINETIFVTSPGIIFVPSLIKKFFPFSRASSSIHRIVAVTAAAVLIPESTDNTQPLDTSTSLSNWIVTGWPSCAASTFLSPTWILFTCACSLLGSVVIASPTWMFPASIWPWKPLNSWFGRHTRCTGI